MANEVSQGEIHHAIQDIAHAQGVLMLAVKVIDEQVCEGQSWEASEAVHGAIRLIERSYCTLNNATPLVQKVEA